MRGISRYPLVTGGLKDTGHRSIKSVTYNSLGRRIAADGLKISLVARNAHQMEHGYSPYD